MKQLQYIKTRGRCWSSYARDFIVEYSNFWISARQFKYLGFRVFQEYE
jgi:hypothetical protein